MPNSKYIRCYSATFVGLGHLDAQGIEMIAPHRHNRKKPMTQDGRKLPAIDAGGSSKDSLLC